MPNWVTAKLTIEGTNSTEIMKSLLTPNEENEFEFDFNKIIEMPKELEIEKGSFTNKCVNLYLTALNPKHEHVGMHMKSQKEYDEVFRLLADNRLISKYDPVKESELEELIKHADEKFKTVESQISHGKHAVDNLRKHGFMDWYDWSIENWGTKWNACNNIYLEEHPNEICFDTAWGNVSDLIAKLSEMYPENKFTYEFADEDTAFQTGNLTFQKGEIIAGCHFPDQSKEAYEQYFKLWGEELAEDFKFDEDKQTYIYKDEDENDSDEEM